MNFFWGENEWSSVLFCERGPVAQVMPTIVWKDGVFAGTDGFKAYTLGELYCEFGRVKTKEQARELAETSVQRLSDRAITFIVESKNEFFKIADRGNT